MKVILLLLVVSFSCEKKWWKRTRSRSSSSRDSLDKELANVAASGGAADVDALIKKGADVNRPIGSGKDTPFTYAVIASNKEVVHFLLPNVSHSNIICALDKVIETQNIEMLKMFLGHFVENGEDQEIENIFLLAIENSTLEVVKEVLRGRDYLPSAEGMLKNGIILAVKNNIVDVAEILLSNGANIDMGGSESPLFILAVERDYLDMAKLLIEFGADVNEPNENGQTPLMVSILSPTSDEMMKMLMGENANPFVKDNSDRTIAEYANSYSRSVNNKKDLLDIYIESKAIEMSNLENRGNSQES